MRKYLKPFVTDGCSGGLSYVWKKIFKQGPPFEHCCVSHDEDYYLGGGKHPTALNNFKLRLASDNRLLACMWKNGWVGKLFCVPTWLAVRLGGGSYWKMPYSWGFGWAGDAHE